MGVEAKTVFLVLLQFHSFPKFESSENYSKFLAPNFNVYSKISKHDSCEWYQVDYSKRLSCKFSKTASISLAIKTKMATVMSMDLVYENKSSAGLQIKKLCTEKFKDLTFYKKW